MTTPDRSLMLTPGSPRCYCTCCGALFLASGSFDLHRGIEASNDEDHQDLGRCLTRDELRDAGVTEYEPDVWGTDDEVATAERFKAMRGIRQKGKTNGNT